ncbi:hypothetical protein OG401_36515 [Kitasatospora purpeofusca]|uniref:hypothetical protein n=1 Tax=Kitasatospora purpeofusca TaxID=67352 RepID=UPI00224D31E8|nr:hypothetical protein [Kitasatospora purpeofusca]MCX4689732.1 hypothetical protein [Kitasatospora purpeofusca]
MSAVEPVAEPGGDASRPPGPASSSSPPIHWSIYVLICAVLVGYAAMMTFLALKRGDANWDRLVFLFSGLEAIVFAAAGLAFGGSVQRGALNAAREDAATARAEAGRQAEAAEAGRDNSDVLDTLLSTIGLGAAAERAGAEGGTGADGGDAARTAELPPGAHGARPLAAPARSWTMVELEQFARTLKERKAAGRRTS